jgi:hypothetical protein
MSRSTRLEKKIPGKIRTLAGADNLGDDVRNKDEPRKSIIAGAGRGPKRGGHFTFVSLGKHVRYLPAEDVAVNETMARPALLGAGGHDKPGQFSV